MIHKKGLATLALLLLSLSLFVSCTQAHSQTAGNDSETQIPLEDLQFELKAPSEELLRKIENDYSSYLKETSSYDPSSDGIYCVKNYYGVYNGCIPVMFAVPETGAYRDVSVADAVFHYSGSNSIIIWCDGGFFSLDEAYKSKKINCDHISIIANLHNTGSFISLDLN